jgi:hypothetical protein
MVKNVVNDAATAERAALDKRVTNAAAEVKAADDTAAAERATAGAVSQDVAEPPRTPMTGAKRVVVSEGSTPPTKW